MEKSDWIAIIAIVLVILIGVAVYFTFFFSYTCDDLSCYQAHQRECAKTSFINDEKDITWEYFIKGKDSGRCVVNVKVLRVKKGDVSNEKLEGKNMDCYLPMESSSAPESDISRCHGVLKEEMQNIIIQKLHSYVLENIGQISSELEKAI